MNIQRKNSTHHFRMQSEREQTLVTNFPGICAFIIGFSWTKVRENNSETSKRMLTKFVSIGKYVLLVLCTLITSTKVFSLIIICKSL